MNITDYFYKENTQENRDKLSELINQKVIGFYCKDGVLNIDTMLQLQPAIHKIVVNLSLSAQDHSIY